MPMVACSFCSSLAPLRVKKETNFSPDMQITLELQNTIGTANMSNDRLRVALSQAAKAVQPLEVALWKGLDKYSWIQIPYGHYILNLKEK
jgi:hypothetical protein